MNTNSASVSGVLILISVIFFAVFLGLIYLQVKLSRKPQWTYGLIIPVANFLLVVLITALFALYSATGVIKTGSTSTVLSGDYKVTVYSDGSVEASDAYTGEHVEYRSENDGLYEAGTDKLIITDSEVLETLEALRASEGVEMNDGGYSSGLAGIVWLFLLFNIPTLLYLLIYFLVRRGVNSTSQLDKIEIQDY